MRRAHAVASVCTRAGVVVDGEPLRGNFPHKSYMRSQRVPTCSHLAVAAREAKTGK